MGEGQGHKPCFIALIVLVAVVFILTLAINGLASVPESSGGLYLNKTGDLSDLYYLEITPAGWTFSIWGFIYAWQALWIIYGIVNIFRKTEQGPVYVNPPILSPLMYGIYFVNLCLNIGWLILWDRQLVEIALPDLFLISFTLYVLLFITYRDLNRNMDTLYKQGRTVDIWLVRGFVHNGLAIYATWTSIATLLNLGHVLAYRSTLDISVQTASTVSLSVLTAEIAVFLITDFVFMDKFSRYTVTPYMVLIVALVGSMSKNWTPGSRNSIFTAVLLGVASVAAVVKVVLLLWRHFKTPKYSVDINGKDEIKV